MKLVKHNTLEMKDATVLQRLRALAEESAISDAEQISLLSLLPRANLALIDNDSDQSSLL